MYGHKLNRAYRIRLSENDLALLNELKNLKIHPSKFIRETIRNKIESDLPELIEKEKIIKSQQYCPF